MKAVHVINESLLKIVEMETPSVTGSQVLIKVHAAGMNRADLAQKKGSYPPPPGESEILGLEVAGTIEKVGSKVKGWQTGDRVCALLAGGGYAEFVSVDHRLLIRIPENMNYVTAAGIPEAFLTAFLKLSLTKPKRNEIILIHAGASGVGTAAIQLSRLLGLKTIITAGSKNKIEKCKELGADFGINYKQQDIASEVHNITEGKGADIILDFIGASYWNINISSIALDGRWVIIGFLGGEETKINMKELLKKRVSLIGSNLRGRTVNEKAQLTHSFSKSFTADFEKGALYPVIDRIFDWNEVNKAHKYMEENLNIGKIILKIN